MSESHTTTPDWPEDYCGPAIEPVGTVWDHTGGSGNSGSDGTTFLISL